jgi:hypothetical protein
MTDDNASERGVEIERAGEQHARAHRLDLAQALQHDDAVEIAHAVIDERDVEQSLAGGFECGVAVVDGDDLVAVGVQHHRQRPAHALVVVDHEHGRVVTGIGE